MKKAILLILSLFLKMTVIGQISVSQNFDGAGTWGYTGGTVNSETSKSGSNSLRIGRDDGSTSCGVPTDATEIVFDPVFPIGTSCPGTFEFYHSVRTSSGSGCGFGRGMDSREGFAVYVKLNGASVWTNITSFSGFANLDWNWSTNAVNGSSQCGTTPFPNPFVYNIPPGSTSAIFKIVTIAGTGSNCTNFVSKVASATGSNYDRGDEGFFIDDVSFTTISPCVLPIELVDFYGTKNQSQNDITWKVAQENGVNYYILEKSKDGINFELLTTSIANHESGTKNYTAIDENPYKEITYYRLKTKESNGTETIYKIISVEDNNTNWSYTYYTQPNNIVVEFKNSIPKNTVLELFDIAGHLIVRNDDLNTQTKLSTEQFAAGLYFIRLSTPYKTEHFKIIISK